MAELRRLAENFQFGEGLSDALGDRLVCGLHNEGTQRRLLIEENLTLTRALKIAISVETAAKDAGKLQGKKNCNVLKLHTKKKHKTQPCY